MPFDATNYADNEVSASGVEVGKLRRLSEALKGEMPGWRWDFSYISNTCGTSGCALGLACAIGVIAKEHNPYEIFGLSRKESHCVFWSPDFYGASGYRDVTPLMVAAALDRIIARETA